uniref:2'-phosphotransferase n=1 Tax=Pseudonaja textilis TaxID=8673 RepID=A0A670ZIU7_PSETE
GSLPQGRRKNWRLWLKPNVIFSTRLKLSLSPFVPESLDGFVDLGEILRLPQFKAWSEEDVKRVVETNEKQRFALCRHPSSGHLQIRANQGHSIQVPELELTPLQDLQDFPETVAHGTLLRHWPAIRQRGLSRMGRTHIHLAPGLPGDGDVLSGMRNSSEVAIILDIPKALADGIPFFRSANGVILSPGNADGLLLPRYFSRALQLRPRRKSERIWLPRGPCSSEGGQKVDPITPG